MSGLLHPDGQPGPAAAPAAVLRSRSASPKPAPKSPPPPRPPPPPAKGKAAAGATPLRSLLTLAALTPGTAMHVSGHATAAATSSVAAPLRSLFPREIVWPPPADFAWPVFEHIAFYEHSGAFRDAWPGASCSVADRFTDSAPQEGDYHFVANVHEFLLAYPHPIPSQTNSVVCTWTTWAQHDRWPEFIRSGRMFEQADEFLLLLYMGARAANEHPPCSLSMIVGPPSFITTAFEHWLPQSPEEENDPVRAKTFWWWTRNRSVVEPSQPVPQHLQRPRASHADRQTQMLLRSTFPRSLARAHARVWSKDEKPCSGADRPASSVAPGYSEHRQIMCCNYAAFSANYANAVSPEYLDLPGRPSLLVAVPIGRGPYGLAALAPVQGGCFAAPLQAGVPLLQQMEAVRAYLPCHETPQHASVTRDAHGDVVFALPVIFPIVTASSTREPTLRGHMAAWLLPEALQRRAYTHTVVAMQRVTSFTHAVPWLPARIGVMQGPQPVTPNRASARYFSLLEDDDAEQKWRTFLAAERDRLPEIVRAFESADAGSGLLAPFLACANTAATLHEDLVPPPQGLPRLDVQVISMLAYPLPPAPLHTSYIARMPPQQLPPGFPTSFTYEQVLAGWGRRLIADCISKTAAHDFEAYRQGWSELPRHPFVCLGPGAFLVFQHVDGTGSTRLNQFCLHVCEDGRLRPSQFEFRDHKSLPHIIGQMGFTTDQELLSFLIHGMRWKVEAPRHIRFSHNVFSLKNRARGVGEATAKLIDAGICDAWPVVQEGVVFTASSPCPLVFTPQYSVGMGGADKVDSDEKRPCGNTSDPHVLVRERNHPHGNPDGDIVINFNDLTGRKGAPPGEPQSFPDREHKHTSREVYALNAVMHCMACVNGTTPCASKDDVRWMFFQLRTEPCEYWLQIQYLVIGQCSECGAFWVLCACAAEGRRERLFLFKIMPRAINMGTRPSSKVAVRFSKEWNVEWRARMADFVQAMWLPRQTAALRTLLAERERKLGYENAHPFGTFEFTDDFFDVACAIDLSAHGALTRRQMAKELGLWMSRKTSCGTVVDYIGGRHVLAGGFGTVSPPKRARCVGQSVLALRGSLSRDEYEANVSLWVHIADLLAIPRSMLEGNWAPLKVGSLGHLLVALADFPRAADNHRLLIHAVRTRPAASFETGFTDAPTPSSAASRGPAMYLRMSSDCRADGGVTCVFGALLEYEWKVVLSDLDPRWARRHINVGESTGAAVNVAVFGRMFGCSFELIQEGDNMVEGPMLMGRARTPDQRHIGACMRNTVGYGDCAENLWFEHGSGLGLGFADAGSREYVGVLDNLAAAFGRRRHRLDVLQQPDVVALLSSILEGTTEYIKRVARTPRVTRFAPSASDLRALQPELRGAGICPSSIHHNSGSEPFSKQLPPTPTPPPPQPAASSIATRNSPVGSFHPESSSRRLPPTPPPPPPQPAAPSIAISTSQVVSPRPAPPLTAADDSAGDTELTSCRPRMLGPTPPRPAAVCAAPAHAPTARQLTPSPAQPLRASSVTNDSPQPRTASAARAAEAADMVGPLVAMSSLPPPEAESTIGALVAEAAACELDGIPRNSRYHCEWGFRWAMRFCTEFGFRWMRPRVLLPEALPAEGRLYGLMVLWITPRMQPGKRKAEKGATRGQPPSALQAVFAWRRVQRDCGRALAPMNYAYGMIKGLVEQHKRDFGQDSLAPAHHVPYPLESICKACAYLDSYACASWTRQLHDALGVLVRFCMVRGPRLDEFAEMFVGDTFYRRSNFNWCRDTGAVAYTQLIGSVLSLFDGRLLQVRNVPSKTDRSGAKWVGKMMYYRARVSQPLNFAAAWARYELKYPCPVACRTSWPAFSPTAAAATFKPVLARQLLTELWCEVETPAFADIHSWHDFRATIATAVMAKFKNPALAQALVCWASPASVELYGGALPDELADAAEAGTSVDASRNPGVAIPHTSNESVLRDLAACLEYAADSPPAKQADGKRAVPASACTKRAKPTRRPRAPPSQPTAPSPPAGSVTPPPSHTLPEAPPAPAPMTFDVGPPQGVLQCPTPSPLDGERVYIRNSAWGCGGGGTWCTIVGYAPDAICDCVKGFFVVRSDEEETVSSADYAFSRPALKVFLRKALRARLRFV